MNRFVLSIRLYCFFFFKQKTAYEMRISDWSSDVCSSDLNPELSMQEVRTAGIAADWLEKYGFEVHRNIGKTGVVGLLKNGDGPCILLRADMDGLPVKEKTGLDYASKAAGTDRFEIGRAHV